MPHLFRAYSDQSRGTNTSTLFAPQAASACVPITDYVPPAKKSEELGKCLKTSLGARKLESPFVFFTASLMFAVQVARTRKQKGETNVRMTAVDIDTARTPAGKPVTFMPVPTLLKDWGIRLERADGSDKDYRDTFLVMECAVPGTNSKTATLDDLERAGIYRLYPALTGGDERSNGRSRLNRIFEDL